MKVDDLWQNSRLCSNINFGKITLIQLLFLKKKDKKHDLELKRVKSMRITCGKKNH